MSSEFNEQTLISSARQGDLQAFNQLALLYQDLLFSIALRVLGDEDSAADAAQCALISAFCNFGQFRGVTLRSWLTRMVLNACYDEIRRRHRRRENPLFRVDVDGEEIESDVWLVDQTPGPEERVEMLEWEQVLQDCLQSLKPVYRVILVMVDMEGLNYQEAASAAGIPIGTVKSRLARARLALRQRLLEIPNLLPARYRSGLPLHELIGERCS